MGLVWTVTARGGKGGFVNRGGRLAVRHGRVVYTLISCAAKQLKYFLYPTTEKVTFKSFKFSCFVLTCSQRLSVFLLS